MTSYLHPWSAEEKAGFGNTILRSRHRLLETGLFDRQAIERLIEGYPSSHYNLCMTGTAGGERKWLEGEFGRASGGDVLAAIENNRMWLNLRRVMEVDPRYAAVLDGMFAEMAEMVPGFKPFKLNLGILVSSPRAEVYYHADVPGQGLLQLAGEKRIWIYPNTPKFLPEHELEGIILGETEEEISYDPAYDADAQMCQLGAGDMVTWPLNAPHRVQNLDSLNISVTIEYWTQAIRDAYAIRYANGLLRRRLGVAEPSLRRHFLNTYPKAAIAVAHRKLKRGAGFSHKIRFHVNAADENGVREVEAYDKAA